MLGHNGGAIPITLKNTGATLPQTGKPKIYDIMQDGKKIGMAFGTYYAPMPGYAGCTIFNATIHGDEFTGSRARLMTWLEKKMDV